MSQSSGAPAETEKPRKRKIFGRKSTLTKKIKLSNHKTGLACNCKHLKCFDRVSAEERDYLVNNFNLLESKDEQDCFLSNLIKIEPVHRRRPLKDANGATKRNNSFKYYVNTSQNQNAASISVCKKALCAIFGVSKRRIERLAKALAGTGIFVVNFSYIC